MIHQKLKDTSKLFSVSNDMPNLNKMPIPVNHTTSHSQSHLIACLHSLSSVKRDLNKKQSVRSEIYQSLIVQENNLKQNKNNQQSLFPKLSFASERLSQTSYDGGLFNNSNNNNFKQLSAVQKISSSCIQKTKNFHKQIQKRTLQLLNISAQKKNQLIDKTSLLNKDVKQNFESKFRVKKIKHLYELANGKTLTKENKYFPTELIKINEQQINKIGLYETSNRYRKECIPEDTFQKLSPKVKRKQIQFVKTCKQNQLFLTRPKQLAPFELGQFLISQFSVKNGNQLKNCQRDPIKEYIQERTNQEEDKTSQFLQENKQENNQKQDLKMKHVWVLQIKNYQIQQTSEYIQFKSKHIQNWNDITSLISQILSYLKQIKISHCKFQAQKLLNFWSGLRLTKRQIQTIIKFKPNLSNNEKASNILKILLAKRQAKKIINQYNHKLYLIKWVRDRLKGILAIKKQKQYKINKAIEMQRQLQQKNSSWDVQIYISSFSQSSFVRNSTQYMESFENMFCHMWRQSSKQMILVIPTVNSQILKFYQQKLKIKRSITIICPQIHDIFPTNISLAASLFFSYQAINKIKKIILNKKAVLVPGKFSDPHYELLISQYLKAPLMTSLQTKNQLKSQKQIFVRCMFSELPYISLEPNSSQLQIIKMFANLLVKNKNISNWIFKINGQFSGRGLATFSGNSSKKYRQILQQSFSGNTRELENYLQKNLKLKLKVNFQNCLFMISDYFISLGQKGGIIEQQKKEVQSYELSFFIQNKQVNLLACFRGFSVNYSNKAYIYQAVLPQAIQKRITYIRDTLLNQKFLGYVSIALTLLGQQIFGIQIKAYMTPLSSIQPVIRTIQGKRQLTLNLKGNSNQKLQAQSSWRKDFISKRKNQIFQINNMENLRQSEVASFNCESAINLNFSSSELQTLRFTSRNSSFKYLFIPYLILTDVPPIKKAQLIQQLIIQTWGNRKINIMDECSLYFSSGLTLSLLIIGKNMKSMKKTCISMIQKLTERANALKIYVGKHQTKDIFHFGDLIKAVTQIKSQN